MRTSYILSLSWLLLSCVSVIHADVPTKTSLQLVSGTLTSTRSYCKGVAPSPEEQARYQHAHPLNEWVYVRKGDKNNPKSPIVDSTRTNEHGYFEFLLPPGEYTLFTSIHRDESIIDRIHAMESDFLQVDNFCLKKWFESGLFQVTVSDSAVRNLDHNFHYRCFVPYAIPCISYTGPYPP